MLDKVPLNTRYLVHQITDNRWFLMRTDRDIYFAMYLLSRLSNVQRLHTIPLLTFLLFRDTANM